MSQTCHPDAWITTSSDGTSLSCGLMPPCRRVSTGGSGSGFDFRLVGTVVATRTAFGPGHDSFRVRTTVAVDAGRNGAVLVAMAERVVEPHVKGATRLYDCQLALRVNSRILPRTRRLAASRRLGVGRNSSRSPAQHGQAETPATSRHEHRQETPGHDSFSDRPQK